MPCFVIVIVVTITVYSAAHFGASMSIVVATPFSLLKIKTKTIPKSYSYIIINLTVLYGHSYLDHYLSTAAFTKYTRCHIWICMYVVI